VFPNLNEKEITKIVNNSWQNLGHNLFELTFLNKLLKEKNTIEIKGLEILKKIRKENLPVIFFSIHSSNWEVCVPFLDQNDFKTGAIYRHINNNFFNRYVYKQRTDALKTKDSFYTPKGKVSAKEILEGVINNKNIFLLVDQKDSAGTEVNFFSKKVKTQTGFLKIARKYNLKIVPMRNIRLPNNKFQITFEQPLLHDNDEVNDDRKMLEINSIIENWIRQNPDNWFWQHKRFN
ncbi:lysophospholipid acyltransferase family protein, partial [Alphaproteobacteria bacterium]|nr:lysophospholipid acyltransferase family protein [Alphaproteobacteria bacterium]